MRSLCSPRFVCFWVCSVVVGCSSSVVSNEAATVETEAGAADASADAEVVESATPTEDAEPEQDAAVEAAEDDAASSPDADEDVDAGVDSTSPPVDSGQPPVDSGADTSSPPVDAGADAGPCVDYVSVPTSPLWTIRAHYTLSPTTSQSVPYVCPDGVVGNSCKFALGNPADGKKYPAAGACRITVPTQCLPCTNGVTQW